MAELGDYLNSINQTKINIMRTNQDDPKAVSGFSGFIIKRLLSYHQDCIYEINEINCIPDLDPQLQYEYLLHALTKKKRYSKLHKTATAKNLELVKRFYGYNDQRAMEVLALHTDDQFAQLEAHLNVGGVISEQRKQPSTGHGRNRPDKAG